MVYEKWGTGGRGMNDRYEFYLIVGALLLGGPMVASSESASEIFRSGSAHPAVREG